MKQPYKLDDEGHALDRFIERHLVGEFTDRADAEAKLMAILPEADFLEVEKNDQQIWRGPRGVWRHVLLVVQDGVVSTVLPVGATRPTHRRTR